MSIQATEMGKSLEKVSIFKVCFELGTELGLGDEFPVSGGREFQSRGPMKEKALLSSDDRCLNFQNQRNSIFVTLLFFIVPST